MGREKNHLPQVTQGAVNKHESVSLCSEQVQGLSRESLGKQLT